MISCGRRSARIFPGGGDGRLPEAGSWWIDWHEGRRRRRKKTHACTEIEAKRLLAQVRAKVLPRELEFDEEVEGDDPALVDFVRRNRPGFAFLASSPPAVPVARLRRSGKSAAVFLGRFLFVQSRRRTLRPGDIDVLLGLDAPHAPAAAPNGEAVEVQRPKLEDEALYEPEWVARFLGIAPGTLYNRVNKGKLPHVKVGGGLRFMGKQLREWLESQAMRPTEDDEQDPISGFPWDKGDR